MPFNPKVMPGENGWPGVFISADDALGFANDLEIIAYSVERDSVPRDNSVQWLRRKAVMFRSLIMAAEDADG